MKKLLLILAPVFLFGQQIVSSFSNNTHDLYFSKTFEQDDSTYIMTYFLPFKKSVDKSRGIKMMHFDSNNQLAGSKIITLNGKPVSYGYTIKVKSREANKASVDMIRILKTKDNNRRCEFSSGILDITEGTITNFKTHYTVAIQRNSYLFRTKEYSLLWHDKQFYLMQINMEKNLLIWIKFDTGKPKTYSFTVKKSRLRILKNHLYFYRLYESSSKRPVNLDSYFIRFFKNSNSIVLVDLFINEYSNTFRHLFPINIVKFDLKSGKISYKSIRRGQENAKKRSTAVSFLKDNLYYTKLSKQNKIVIRQLDLNNFNITDLCSIDSSTISNKNLSLIKYNYRVNNDKKSTIKKSDFKDMLKIESAKSWWLNITQDKTHDNLANIEIATTVWRVTFGQAWRAYSKGFYRGPFVPQHNKLSFSFNRETQQINPLINKPEHSFSNKYYQHIAYFRKNYSYQRTYKGSMKIMYNKTSQQYEIIDFDKPFNMK